MLIGHGDDSYRYGGLVKFNFSSNIYAGADLSALKRHLAAHLDSIANYPEPEPLALEAAIAAARGVRPCEVLATNGVTEAIYTAARSLVRDGEDRPLRHVISQPTFSEYADACTSCGIVPQFSREALPHAEDSAAGHTVYWLCSPNNPTGTVIPAGELLRRIDGSPNDIFIIDQSYEDYTLKRLISDPEAVSRPNIILLHSMTKRFCVPGLRIGCAIANGHLLSRLRSLRWPWSINALSLEAGMFLVSSGFRPAPDMDDYLSEARRLRLCLNSISGITAFESDTNFMLCRSEHIAAARIKELLVTRHGLLIRDASNFAGLDSHFFRVAAQSREADDMLVSALKDVLNGLQHNSSTAH